MANNSEQGTVYPYFPTTIVDKHIEKLSELNADTDNMGEETYIYVEDGCQDWDELATLIQAMLTEWQETIPNIAPCFAYIKACYFCDKMRQDEFGGFAIFITADNIKYNGTAPWIEEQIIMLTT